MNQQNKTENNQSKFIKLLKKNVKRVIAEKGINAMTRKGDKELDLLVKKIVNKPIQTKEEALQLGERLGEEIAELSKQKGKTNLDKSLIRILATQGELPLSITVSPQEKQPSPPSTVKAASSTVPKTTVKEEETLESTVKAAKTPVKEEETPESTLKAPEISIEEEETPESTLKTPEISIEEEETPEVSQLRDSLSSDSDEDSATETEEIASLSEESQQEELLPS